MLLRWMEVRASRPPFHLSLRSPIRIGFTTAAAIDKQNTAAVTVEIESCFDGVLMGYEVDGIRGLPYMTSAKISDLA